MVDLQPFARLVSGDHGLAVVALALADGTAHASVVNAGVLPHPVTGAPAVGVVARGQAAKLRYLRANPRATIVLRYLDGLTERETAAVLECSEGTVKSQTSRALTRLNRFFTREELVR